VYDVIRGKEIVEIRRVGEERGKKHPCEKKGKTGTSLDERIHGRMTIRYVERANIVTEANNVKQSSPRASMLCRQFP
jgi:hypothetical protein